MGCGCACGAKTITGEQKRVLAAMEKWSGPCTAKDISASTGLDAKIVSKDIADLKKLGYVDSPVRCKCGITESGRKVLQD
jgi:Fur family transcriptional regulator, peroxide stress response regulator